MKRCHWSNLEKHAIDKEYHDWEWGIPSYDDRYLFEMFLLESFHCGLSWLLILNKREYFRNAFDNFNPDLIRNYDEDKIKALLADKTIVRNEAKIRASIKNAKCFIRIQKECGSFCNYIWAFSNNEVVFRTHDRPETTNELSDRVSKDFKKRGFKFMGSITVFSYLEAIGVMNNHYSYCFKAQLEETLVDI